MTYLLSGGSSFTMYENDEIDVTGVGMNNIESVRDPNDAAERRVPHGDSLNVYYIGFNMTTRRRSTTRTSARR